MSGPPEYFSRLANQLQARIPRVNVPCQCSVRYTVDPLLSSTGIMTETDTVYRRLHGMNAGIWCWNTQERRKYFYKGEYRDQLPRLLIHFIDILRKHMHTFFHKGAIEHAERRSYQRCGGYPLCAPDEGAGRFCIRFCSIMKSARRSETNWAPASLKCIPS